MKKLLFILMLIPFLSVGQSKIRNTQLTSGSQPAGKVLKSDGATNVVWSNPVTVTTSGTTGPATQRGDTINIPQYVGGGGSVMVYPDAGIATSTGIAWGTSITDNSINWNTAYTDRLKWDGGSTGLNAATGRTSLELGSAAQSATTDFAPAFSGTTGYIPKFTGTNAIGNSILSQSGTRTNNSGVFTIGAYNDFNTSGVGMELFYHPALQESRMQSYDRTNSVFKNFRLQGDKIIITANEVYIDNLSSTNPRLLSASSTGQLTSVADGVGVLKSNGSGTISYINDSQQSLSGTNVTWNLANGKDATITLTGNTVITLSNATNGISGTIWVTNPSTVYTITFAGYVNSIDPFVRLNSNVVITSGGSKFDDYTYKYNGTKMNWNGTLDRH